MGLIGVVLIVFGVLALAAGAREVRSQRTMRREGIRSVGTVLRYITYQSRDTESPGPRYAPVVRYRDEHGQIREFEGKIQTSIQRPAVGQSVRVVQRRGRPGSARLDTAGNKALSLVMPLGIGIVFLAVALIMRP